VVARRACLRQHVHGVAPARFQLALGAEDGVRRGTRFLLARFHPAGETPLPHPLPIQRKVRCCSRSSAMPASCVFVCSSSAPGSRDPRLQLADALRVAAFAGRSASSSTAASLARFLRLLAWWSSS